MTRPNRSPRPAPRATFEAALARPTHSAEVRTVVDLLGGRYEVRPYEPSAARYDPREARTDRWEFPDAPRAWPWWPTSLRARDGVVVALTIAAELVSDAADARAVTITVPDDTVPYFSPQGAEWNWAPSIVTRGDAFLLRLDVGQGHWDGSYLFPLTRGQAERMSADLLLYREVWEGLVRICQSRRFLEDPATLPADAQSLIDARCGRG